MGTIHTVESIKDLLGNSNAAVERALIVLYERQTADEQVSAVTSHKNGRGFNAIDAEILTSFACQVEKNVGRGLKLGQCLSEKQMVLARKKVVRYVKQLVEVANEKAGAAAAQVEIDRLKAEGVITAKAAVESILKETNVGEPLTEAVYGDETMADICADVEAASRPGGYEEIKKRIAAWALR